MKRSIKGLLLKGQAFGLVDRLTRGKVAILRYHSIKEDPEYFANLIGLGNIHAKSVFKKQMELIAHRCNPVSLDDILLFLKGDKDIGKRAVAVTFDDGYADNYEIAAPILNRFGIPAAFFVTVRAVETQGPPWFCRLRYAFATTPREEWSNSYSKEKKSWSLKNEDEKQVAFLSVCEELACLAGESQEAKLSALENEFDAGPFPAPYTTMMSWDQIRRLQKTGHIIGSHSLTHPNLAYVNVEDLCSEIIESKRILERELGGPVKHFGYPHPRLHPHWTEKSVEVTREAGYEVAVTCDTGPVHAGTMPLLLNRIRVEAERTDFEWNLEWTLLGRKM